MLAMLVSIVLSVLLLFPVPGWAAEGGVFPDLDINEPVALQEGSRVIEEELKLAARPQTYLILDLVSGAIQIKARGVDLHRIPIAAWTVTELPRLTGTFRLTARPRWFAERLIRLLRPSRSRSPCPTCDRVPAVVYPGDDPGSRVRR